jgi:hypothetical protein
MQAAENVMSDGALIRPLLARLARASLQAWPPSPTFGGEGAFCNCSFVGGKRRINLNALCASAHFVFFCHPDAMLDRVKEFGTGFGIQLASIIDNFGYLWHTAKARNASKAARSTR